MNRYQEALNKMCSNCRTGAIEQGYKKGCAFVDIDNSRCDTYETLQELVEKSTPKKPTFVDTRFRSLGKYICDGVSLDKCYKCPNCKSHIFHVWEHDIYCPHCGQALEWGVDDE